MALVTGWSEEHFKSLAHGALPRRSVVDILHALPAMVSPDTPIYDAAALALQWGTHYLPVVNARGEAQGVVCRCDLHGAPPADEVASVMKTPAITLDVHADAEQAARVMLERSLGCLPVVDAFTVVGMVTREELLRAELLSPRTAPACELCGSLHHVVVCEDPHVAQCRQCRDGSTRFAEVDERELGGGD